MAERATIIGAGIVGICTAISLLEKGFDVLLIDRNEPAEGASHGNAGVVSPWTCVPQSMPGVWRSIPKWLFDAEGPIALKWSYLPKFIPWAIKFLEAGKEEGLPAIADAMQALNRPNVDLYRQLLEGTGSEHLIVESMYVHVSRHEDAVDLNSLAWKLREERGVPIEVAGPERLREVEPDLSPAYKTGVLMKGQARAVDPGGVGKALAEKAKRMGADFLKAGVHRIEQSPTGEWNIHTDAGERKAINLIIAAGAWSARLLEPLGYDLPLEAERGYHLIFQNPGITVNNSIMDADAKFVASSMAAGVRCAGTAEFAGLDALPDYRRAQVFVRLAKHLFPDINTKDTIEWMGSRPSFPDSLPCLGEIPSKKGLFCAFGHSHYGFGMAPNTGRVVASIVTGEPVNIDLTPYQISRF
jgi:D-amino-acid dehydrogenase